MAGLLLVLSGAVPAGVGASTEPPVATATGRVKSGTGFFVSRDGLLLTSAHGVAGCAAISVWPRDRTARTARVIAADQRLDIALLATHSGAVSDFATAPDRWRPMRGEEVVAVGFGIDVERPLRPFLLRGVFLGDGETPAGSRAFVIRARVPSGASGGLVLDHSGSLVGMVVGYYTDRPDLGVLVSSADIADFLALSGVQLTAREESGHSGLLLQQLLGMSALVQCTPSRERDAHRTEGTEGAGRKGILAARGSAHVAAGLPPLVAGERGCGADCHGPPWRASAARSLLANSWPVYGLRIRCST